MQRLLAVLLTIPAIAGCSSSATPADPGPANASTADASTADASDADASAGDAAVPDSGPMNKAAACASSDSQLGAALTSGHGRVDGTVSAVVPPADEACTISANSTHMTIELKVAGKIERVVLTATDTDAADGKMHFLSKDAPLVGPAWAEGWHTGADAALDYVNGLGAHGPDFKPLSIAELTAAVSDPIGIGDRISLFSTSDDTPGTALYGTRSHLVHRYSQGGAGADGAVVLHPDTTHPTWLLFYYASEANF
jgi:hypothetical protein